MLFPARLPYRKRPGASGCDRFHRAHFRSTRHQNASSSQTLKRINTSNQRRACACQISVRAHRISYAAAQYSGIHALYMLGHARLKAPQAAFALLTNIHCTVDHHRAKPQPIGSQCCVSASPFNEASMRRCRCTF